MSATVQLLDMEAALNLLAGVVKQAEEDASAGDSEAESFVGEWHLFGSLAGDKPEKKRQLWKRAKWRK